MKKRALISVSDKTGVLEFAKGLAAHGYEIVSTGGTFELLKDAGAINISDVTGFPEIMDGRVKTLHPAIHGGLLAVRDNPAHTETLAAHGIVPIDIVAVNLYPFKATISKPGVSEAEAVENIDIGGPSMIRSAAKNMASVTVVVDPADYEKILAEIAGGEVTADTRRALAAKAFRHTAAYDALIAAYFTREAYPEKLTLTYELQQSLRYGENPHQGAALYAEPIRRADSIVAAEKLHGKELSYCNLADADAAVEMVSAFAEPTAVAVKHQNPCGIGTGDTISDAYARAFEADPVSIFGGIIALNREVCAKTAAQMSEIFLEVIIAPSYSDDALAILTKKKNLRLLERREQIADADALSRSRTEPSKFSAGEGNQHALPESEPENCAKRGFQEGVKGTVSPCGGLDLTLGEAERCEATGRPAGVRSTREGAEPPRSQTRAISGGLLIQDADTVGFDDVTLTFPTKRKPTDAELKAARFAWTCVKFVKSNGILLARDGMTVGIGPGQTNRVGAAKIAIGDAGERARGAVLASDAFFPMPDTVELAAAAGIEVIIQPGGSVKDADSIAACDKHGIAMIFTGMRHFRH
ncbi:MAG: bifunctional phosphoribosylaminoimidazolecarboxamide formyltransferase/IMP cyclohydrolase [Defluviitaleaceae bacterium]|nr:bifunctional phosphoribosylaminoimidazolecarboxamide formyltransferase/IMP cyclohydrolase [Defluviitaleaceae bacterium]